MDYYHVSEYVADAVEAQFSGKAKRNQRQAWLKETLHNLKQNFGEAKRVNPLGCTSFFYQYISLN